MCTIALVIISTRLYRSKLVTDNNIFKKYNVINSNKILKSLFCRGFEKQFLQLKNVYSEFTEDQFKLDFFERGGASVF
jgi:hypothetical protein